jgi:hypothetical protein
LRLVRDLVVSVPLEICRETAQYLRYASRVYRRRLFVTV